MLLYRIDVKYKKNSYRVIFLFNLQKKSTGDGTFIDLHISTSLDTVLQSVLNGECPTDVLTTLCPNNCSAHGICVKGT